MDNASILDSPRPWATTRKVRVFLKVTDSIQHHQENLNIFESEVIPISTVSKTRTRRSYKRLSDSNIQYQQEELQLFEEETEEV